MVCVSKPHNTNEACIQTRLLNVLSTVKANQPKELENWGFFFFLPVFIKTPKRLD